MGGDTRALQRKRLEAIIKQAHEIRRELGALLEPGKNAHFRPSSKGFSMVGLLHNKAQLGLTGLTDAKHTASHFDELFTKHCDADKPGRDTPEKSLQSFLIRDAYAHRRHMHAIEEASKRSDEPVELLFVTDEIPLPIDSNNKYAKLVCDLLALRVDGGISTPVLIELKSDRQRTRLAEQVERYAPLIDTHADLFAQLFSATLGQKVTFDGPAEKWIVWPAAGWKTNDPKKLDVADDHEDAFRRGFSVGDLRAHQVRTVTYVETEKGSGKYAFRVGGRVR